MHVTVQLGYRSYDIVIEAGALNTLSTLLDSAGLASSRGLVITDETVGKLYGARVRDGLKSAGRDFPVAMVPAGEESKSQACLFGLYDEAIRAGLDRKSLVLALGGGVVGDLAGYAAASFMRGLRYVQVPTTLLSMVDSAVGGKTGINLPQGKNLIGAFHQPSLVVCDLDLLKSLPPREFRAGMAEVIKYGIIYDAGLFGFIEQHLEKGLQGDAAVLAHLVARSCEIKADVVRQDENESGLRAILNFGHTLGHAIEAVAGYGEYLHGEAIAVGMVYAARLSARTTGLPASDVARIEKLFTRAGLPVAASALDWKQLRRAMSVDKKSSSGLPRFVLAREIGKVVFDHAVEEALLEEVWQALG